MSDFEVVDFETALANELPRLVRLCAWFTSHEEAAQDLAQETLIAAWKNREQLVSLDKLKPWTSAIARNICLDWTRRYARERAHTILSIDAPDQAFDDTFADDSNLELELDRHELATLLERALSLLPPETGQMLVEHYIQESSHAEIAARMKINPGTVAVRLQRGKLTLQKLLRKDLQAESLAFGLIGSESSQWEETNIWCPSCGNTRLTGRYQKDEIFALRCPTCDPEPAMIMAGLDLTQPHHARLLGNVKTFKPAYSRLLTGFAPLYQQALTTNTAPCLACGHEVIVTVSEPTSKPHEDQAKQITLQCPACGWASNKSLTGLVFSLPEVQQFWKEHPRLRMLPAQEIEFHGSVAHIRRLHSVQDSAELIVISHSDSLLPVEIHTNVPS